MFVRKAIQDFLQLRSKKIIAIATSTVTAQPLRGGITAHSTFKILILRGESDTCNIPAEIQLAADLQNDYLML